jgi:hypothetical protein
MTMRRTIFRDVTPCSLVKIHRSFGSMYCLHLQGRWVNQRSKQQQGRLFSACILLAWLNSSTLKTEAAYSIETSVNYYWSTLRHILEHSTLLSINIINAGTLLGTKKLITCFKFVPLEGVTGQAPGYISQLITSVYVGALIGQRAGHKQRHRKINGRNVTM